MRHIIQSAVVMLAAAGVSGASAAQPASVRDDARCLSWGAQRGTQAYYECRLTLERERGQRRRNRDESDVYGSPPSNSYGAPHSNSYGAPRFDAYGSPRGPGPIPCEDISDDTAIAQCERHARYAARLIDRLAAKFVAPGHDRRVTLSFRVVRPGPSYGFWNVECRFARGQILDSKEAEGAPRRYGWIESSSGSMTTLSCSFGSVRATTATAGSVALRL